MNISSIIAKYDMKEIDKQLGEKYWSPIDVAVVGNWILRAAAIKGEFHWHSHKTDELFFIYKGFVTIDTKQGPIELGEGQGTVIPAGIEHRPRAQKRAVILFLDQADTKVKGD